MMILILCSALVTFFSLNNNFKNSSHIISSATTCLDVLSRSTSVLDASAMNCDKRKSSLPTLTLLCQKSKLCRCPERWEIKQDSLFVCFSPFSSFTCASYALWTPLSHGHRHTATFFLGTSSVPSQAPSFWESLPEVWSPISKSHA